MKANYTPIWRYSLIESDTRAGIKMCSDLKADRHGDKAVSVIDTRTDDILFTGSWASADTFYRTEVHRRQTEPSFGMMQATRYA